MSSPGTGRFAYARLEAERRWLVTEPSARPAADARRIEDRYLDGTRLRLRSVTAPDGTVVRKLGHKTTPDPGHPSTVWHTSLYLDEGEAAVLGALPGRVLVKDRYVLSDDAGRQWALDVFRGALAGLVLVEVELAETAGPQQAVDLRPPVPTRREVSDDVRYTGGALAGLVAARLGDLLR